VVNAGFGAPQHWGQPTPTLDPGRVESGSPRSYTGIASAIAGTALVVSGFLPWGIASLQDGAGEAQFVLNGFGGLSYQPSFGEPNPGSQQLADILSRADVLASPGLGPAMLGVVGVLAAMAYMSSTKRSAAALVAIGAGGAAAIATLAQLSNVRGMFKGASDLAGAYFAPGLGVFVALFAAVALTALGICAFVLERAVITRLVGTAPPPGPPAYPSVQAIAVAPHTQGAPGPGRATAPVSVPGAPAEAWPRLIAAGIDIAVAAVAAFAIMVLASVIGEFVTTSPQARAVWALLTVLLVAPVPLGYFAVSEARCGRTIGKRIVGIEVQGPTGLTPTLRESLRRNAVHTLLGVALGLFSITLIQLFAVAMALLIFSNLLLLAYVGWLIAMVVSAFTNATRNPWRLGVHDRFADGPTRVVNRTAVPLARSGAAPLRPWWVAAAVVVLLMGLTGVADTVVPLLTQRGSLHTTAPTAGSAWPQWGDPDSAATTGPTHRATVSAPPPIREPSTATRDPQSRTPSAFPAGGTLCPPRYGSTGAYTASASGNDHTSCEFAEEVRIAYADMGQPGSFQHLMVTSPVTNTSYNITCGPAVAGFIVCRGGNDAVVYLN